MKLLAVLVSMSLLSLLVASCTGAPHYSGERTSHFDGKTFRNTRPMNKGAGDMLKLGWGAMTEAAEWPDWVEVSPQTVDEGRVDEGIAVTYINHSTFLLQVAGLNILTDPIYAKRASPFQWTGPARVHAPGVRFEDLPDEHPTDTNLGGALTDTAPTSKLNHYQLVGCWLGDRCLC